MELRRNQPALQVKADNGDWLYVFCYSNETGGIVPTLNRKNALNADLDMAWFQNRFANNEFRAEG